jgi:hypothetical protein
MILAAILSNSFSSKGTLVFDVPLDQQSRKFGFSGRGPSFGALQNRVEAMACERTRWRLGVRLTPAAFRERLMF